jgi:leucyl/phenylalanyl-tRNA---protein transferase
MTSAARDGTKRTMHAPAASPPLEPIDPGLLLMAYRAGVFPMADSRDDPEVFWVEPRRRAVLPLDGLQMSRSLARSLRRGRFQVTCNAAFDVVIDACAASGPDRSETWISQRLAASYRLLHHQGFAHSLECWAPGEHGPALVGGLYGVGFARVFCGESMFSRMPDASKVALAWLVAALRRAGATLLDCQFMTGHLASLGAVEISQKRYLALLGEAQAGGGAGAGRGGGGAGGGATGAAEGAALPAGFVALLSDAELAGLASSPGKLIAQSLTQTS